MEVISDKTDVLRILPEAAVELCSALFRNSPAGIYITRDGKFIYTNIEFRRITGYSQDDLSGRDYIRLINPRYRQQPKQNIASLFEEEETTSHEFKITTKDGKKKWIEEKITYFKYGGNWLTLGHWLDISEHHSVEKAWREAERRFQSAFEDLASGLAIIATDGIFLKVNKSFCDMLAYEEKDVLESRFDDIICPEDREACGDIMSLFLSLEKPELPVQRRLLANDRRMIWTAMSISLIGDTESGPTYFIVNFQDITEQKRIEEGIKEEEKLYRALVNMSLEPVAVTDLDCNITHVSLKFIAMVGCQSAEELVGKRVDTLLKAAEDRPVPDIIMEVLRRGEPGRFAGFLVKQNGDQKKADIDISWVKSSLDSPSCIVIHAREMEVPQPVQPEKELKTEAPVEQFTKTPEVIPVAHQALSTALENTATALLLFNADTIIAAVNTAFEKMSGYQRDEIEGKKSWIEFVAGEDQARLKKYYLLRRIDPGTAPDIYEFKFVNRKGDQTDVLINISDVPETGQQAASLLDVAAYKQALLETQSIIAPVSPPAVSTVQTLADDGSLALIEAMPEIVIITDVNGIITRASQKAVMMLCSGNTLEIVGKSYSRFVRPGMLEDAGEMVKEILESGTCQSRSIDLIDSHGHLLGGEISGSAVSDSSGEPCGIILSFKPAEHAPSSVQPQSESDQYYRLLAEHITDVVWIMDMDLNFIWISPSVERIYGFKPDELKVLPLEKQITPDSLKKVMEVYLNALDREKQGTVPHDFVHQMVMETYRKDATTLWVNYRFQFLRDETGKATGIIAELRDIDQQKKAELARDESEKYYKLMAENTNDAIWLLDMNLNVIWASPSNERINGYTLEELKQLSMDKQVTPESYSHAMDVFAQIMQQEQEGKLPHDLVVTLELESIRKDGSTHWTENQFKIIRDPEGKPISIIVQGRDISERKNAEEAIKNTIQQLESTIDGSIEAIATVIEMRDPYTSGHQNRVAKIAVAIARELSLPEELVKGVEITSKIHDIGKIYVPMEVLARPGLLTEIERRIIQTHAQGSYDILKSIDFPWPVAQTAMQHHERLNGSGYPLGLKENEIMLEAKILMVADVVEAMASNRPYRPSRGIEAALEEIEKNGGILYDQGIVDACLHLFRDKGFTVEETGSGF